MSLGVHSAARHIRSDSFEWPEKGWAPSGDAFSAVSNQLSLSAVIAFGEKRQIDWVRLKFLWYCLKS